MQNINRVTITGNLTRDPELRAVGDTHVCSLRVAVNGRKKDRQSGEWMDDPGYFDVTVWGRSAENCARYLAKGRPVAVDGRLDWQEWKDKDTGANRQKVQIVANMVQFLGDGSGGGQQNGGGQQTSTSDVPVTAGTGAFTPAAKDDMDDVPF